MAKSPVLSKVGSTKKPILLLSVLGLVGLTGVGMAAFLGNANNQTTSDSEAANVPMICGYQIQNDRYTGCGVIYLSNKSQRLDKEKRDVIDNKEQIMRQKKDERINQINGDNVLGVNSEGMDVLAKSAKSEKYDSEYSSDYSGYNYFKNLFRKNPPTNKQVIFPSEYSNVNSTGTKECIAFNDYNSKTELYVTLANDKQTFRRSVAEDPKAFKIGCREVALKTQVELPVKTTNICVFYNSSCMKSTDLLAKTGKGMSKVGVQNYAYPKDQLCITEYDSSGNITCRVEKIPVVSTPTSPKKRITRMPKPYSAPIRYFEGSGN